MKEGNKQIKKKSKTKFHLNINYFFKKQNEKQLKYFNQYSFVRLKVRVPFKYHIVNKSLTTFSKKTDNFSVEGFIE